MDLGRNLNGTLGDLVFPWGHSLTWAPESLSDLVTELWTLTWANRSNCLLHKKFDFLHKKFDFLQRGQEQPRQGVSANLALDPKLQGSLIK